MAIRLSASQKEEIIQLFLNGNSLEELSIKFDCTKATICRNLKKSIDKNKYKECLKNNIEKENHLNINTKDFFEDKTIEKNVEFPEKNPNNSTEEDHNIFQDHSFIEISPIDYEIDISKQKDLSSIPIEKATLPKTVFMIVDKNTELQTKLLKDLPTWQFLPAVDLNREIIEIYFDVKSAKRICNKEEKVIKVPNSEVFKIVSPLLISRGISRILGEDQLIAL